MVITLTKSADKTMVKSGETVNYTYTVSIDSPGIWTISYIEDDIFGFVWTGSEEISIGDDLVVVVPQILTETTTNKARAYYSGDIPTAWSNVVVVVVSVDWKDIPQAINTKEDVEVLNGLTQGNHAWEEIHALRCVKFAKIIDLI